MKRSGPIKRKRRTVTKEYRDGRVVLSDSDWQKMKWAMWNDKKWHPSPVGQVEGVVCGICYGVIYFWDDMELDHIIPRGMGGGTRDDRPDNLQLTHRWCNREKGSKRL